MQPQDDCLMRRKEVEAMVGLSTSTIYAGMRDGTFPTPIRVAKKAVRWKRSTVQNWIDAQEAAS